MSGRQLPPCGAPSGRGDEMPIVCFAPSVSEGTEEVGVGCVSVA